ncbi:glutamine synthetase family protein [Fluviibacterium sp. DFM31]|uniref:Glutamine synthetase family protein n=1 Tax=Meridianimarinicoccus marinus TaxID=3231483 RepID=A0ABV3L7D2_9RHOB
MAETDAETWRAAHPGIDSVLTAVCDLNGTLRGKRVPADQVAKALDGGLRLPLSAVGVDIWGEDIENSALVFASGDADGICQPTGRGILPNDWTSRPTALVPLWLFTEEGAPFAGDPRQALARVVEGFAARGLTPVVATELEFYLFDPEGDAPQAPRSPVTGKRLDSDGVLSLDELQHFDAVLNDIYDSCRAQGIPVDVAISENGAGQFEINMRHLADPLRAADDAILFKRTVRGIARAHGLAATFMAKPYGTRSGNGFHVHVSLIDGDGRNVFDDGTEAGSDLMRHAVAGMIRTMAETALTYAPHENSFRRLAPRAHAPSAIGWGYENRTLAIRIPGGSAAARRIEHRVAGADANPYLVLASVLGGALLGLREGWEPPAPVTGNAYAQDLPHLPPDWASAIEAFETGTHIRQIYDPLLVSMFTDCKRQELGVFTRRVTDFEYHTYLETV